MLDQATVLVVSELTCIECDRAFRRAVAVEGLSAAEMARLQAAAEALWGQCHVFAFDPAIAERARGSFPSEPIRTLHALHWAFYESARRAFGGMALLSLDRRMRAVGLNLGAEVVPE